MLTVAEGRVETPIEPRAAPLRALPRIRLSLRFSRTGMEPVPIRGSADVFGLFGSKAASWDREHFLVLAIDGKGRAFAYEEISVGTLTASLVHPREIFKGLILVNAASCILIHNHPSGDPTPSPEDIALTSRLKQAGELLGIRVLDHVVLGRGVWVSFVDTGRL